MISTGTLTPPDCAVSHTHDTPFSLHMPSLPMGVILLPWSWTLPYGFESGSGQLYLTCHYHIVYTYNGSVYMACPALYLVFCPRI